MQFVKRVNVSEDLRQCFRQSIPTYEKIIKAFPMDLKVQDCINWLYHSDADEGLCMFILQNYKKFHFNDMKAIGKVYGLEDSWINMPMMLSNKPAILLVLQWRVDVMKCLLKHSYISDELLSVKVIRK